MRFIYASTPPLRISRLDFKTRLVTSIRDIEIVLHDPDIIKKLGYETDLNKVIDRLHIGAYSDKKIIALLCVQKSNKGHFYCLKPYRKHAVEIAKALLDLAPKEIWFQLPNKNLENFAMKIGFAKGVT